MRKARYTLQDNECIAPAVYRMVLCRPDAPVMGPGQFVDIALDGKFLRRPLSVCDSRPGALTLVYKTVGAGTRQLAQMPAGAELELLTGLGRGFAPEACREAALLVGGGLGAAPLHLLARELRARGRRVTAVLGFNTGADVVLTEEFARMGVEVHVATLDGTRGSKGLVTDVIAALQPAFDFFYTCGPLPMMKAVCQALPGPGQASLEERMGCGAGFCYGCTVQTASGPRRVCADGPVFDKEEWVW